MCKRRMRLSSQFRGPWNVAAWVIALATLGAVPASAQTGVIAFGDDCTRRLYAIRGDGTGRIALPLPPLPQPTSDYEYSSPLVLDVSTSGPLTVVYFVAINRRNPATTFDFGLFAVQLDDVAGVLVPGSPVRLALPSDIGFGADPNRAQSAAFSRVASGDRLALVANSNTASVLMTAKVDRDTVTSRITGLSDVVVVGDLLAIGVPDPNIPTSRGFTGVIDYSPDGRSIVATIYYDLWVVDLLPDNTYGGASLLTANTNGVAEWNPSVSPDAGRIAFSAGPILSFGGVSARNMDIYSMAPATGAVTRVTSQRTKDGAARDRSSPMWSPDGKSVGFWAYTVGQTRRQSPCTGLVNSEIFRINADGTGTASPITNTNGTSVEAWPKWGW